MATNFAANVAVNELAARRGIEHRFFLTVAILFPIITVIGFAPSYYFKTLFATPPLPSGLVHAHGISMSLWIVLYLVQTYLITSKQIKLHMTLGIFGVILAAAMIVIGIATGYASAARGAAFPGYTPVEFLLSERSGQSQAADARDGTQFPSAVDRTLAAGVHSRSWGVVVLGCSGGDRDPVPVSGHVAKRAVQPRVRGGRRPADTLGPGQVIYCTNRGLDAVRRLDTRLISGCIRTQTDGQFEPVFFALVGHDAADLRISPHAAARIFP